MSNSDNPRWGAEFQRQVRRWFETHYDLRFEEEVKIPIGSRLVDHHDYKEHKFDIASEDRSIIIECKRYTWTESGNVPSAKMGFANEAAFYLSLVNRAREKYLVMLRSFDEKHDQYLAEYYYHTYKHLLGDVIVAEYDPVTDEMRFINKDIIEARRNKRIHELASRYLRLYEDQRTTEEDVCKSFMDECFDLGIQMDTGNKFAETYGANAYSDEQQLLSVIDRIDDVDILASGIFSKWRFITHWCDYSRCLDPENRGWFITAFAKLVELTDDMLCCMPDLHIDRPAQIPIRRSRMEYLEEHCPMVVDRWVIHYCPHHLILYDKVSKYCIYDAEYIVFNDSSVDDPIVAVVSKIRINQDSKQYPGDIEDDFEVVADTILGPEKRL